MNHLCIICRKPNKTWIDFLDKFTAYTIYMVIDDNDTKYKYPNSKINFIQIPNKLCEDAGFKNMNFISQKLVTAWEKAIYFFANLEIDYNCVWFLEDDVFFYNEKTLQDIDSQYPNSDLLTNNWAEYVKGTWNWSQITINFEPPWFSAMVCASRLSKPLINLIKAYASEHKTLFFLEALFPTICKRHNLIYDLPKELNNVLYNITPDESELDKIHVFHPIKNKSNHAIFREILRLKS